jgi:uncharacterized protein
MPPILANKIIKHFSDNFNGVKDIFFFGGEPLLAFETIESVCNYCEGLFSNGHLSVMPSFSLVTNGTLITDRFVKLAKKFGIGITVSVDGPPTTHDIHRRTKCGEGSYSMVLEGIKKIKSADLSFSVECTYTPSHWENGLSFIDLYEYFKELGADGISIIAEMPIGEKRIERNNAFIETIRLNYIDFIIHVLEDYQDTGKMHFEELRKEFVLYVSPPEHLKDNFCNAGINYYAINPEGSTYPCHMLNNQNKYCLGNYRGVKTGTNIFPKKQEFNKCKECPLINICISCPARMYLLTDAVYPIDSQCKNAIAMSTCCTWFLATGGLSNPKR